MRHAIKLILLLVLSLSLTGCFRGRYSSTKEGQKIRLQQVKINKLKKEISRLNIRMEAKDKLLEAQITVIAMTEGGEQSLDAYRNQLYKLALKHSDLIREFGKIATELSECGQPKEDFKTASLTRLD